VAQLATEAPLETTAELGVEFRERRRGGRRQSTDHDVGARRHLGETLSAQVAQPPLYPVPDHGVAHPPAHDEPEPHGPTGCTDDVHHEKAATGALAGPDHTPEVTAMGEPMRGGKHRGGPRSGGRAGAAQTARLLRPLRRREDKMARPARVRMRSRKPCTLWRRRLFV
jgi:hypothetical protein